MPAIRGPKSVRSSFNGDAKSIARQRQEREAQQPQPAPRPYPQPTPQPYPQTIPQPYPQPAPQPHPQPAPVKPCVPKRNFDPNRRTCDTPGCDRPTLGNTARCQRHERRRRKLGHVSMLHGLSYKAIRSETVLARDYLRRNPPSPEVLHALTTEVLSPSASFTIAYTDRFQNARVISRAQARTRATLAWWHDPQSAKKGGRGWKRRHGTDPSEVLAVLLAVTLFTTEREWGNGFAPEMARAMLLLKLRRMPSFTQTNRTRGTAVRATVTIPGVVRKLLGQVISERVGVYLLKSTHAILEEQRERNARLASRPPAAPQAAPPTHFTLTPRYQRPRLLSILDAEKVRAWERHESLWRQHPTGQVPRNP